MAKKRGAKPKPIKIHEINGNPSKRDISKKVNFDNLIEKYDEGEYPKVPEHLKTDAIASKEWERLAPMLARIKVLTPLDIQLFEMYCKSYSRYRTAEAEMDKLKTVYFKTKSDYIQQLPQYSVSTTSSKICREIMAEFGMTPSSRARMELPNEVSDNDKMEDLLNGEDI